MSVCLCVVDRLDEFITTTGNQFGCKAQHGTDLCTYALKVIVNNYRAESLTVFYVLLILLCI